MTESHDLSEFLKDRDRILMAAWTLPNEGPLTDAQRAQAMANFAEYLSTRGITFADVGHEIGKPQATTIRDLVKGIYRKESDEHIRVLNNWIEQHARQAAVKIKGKFVETSVARSIQYVAKTARDQGVMAVVVGPTGLGKTRCAQALVDTISGAILLTIMRRRQTADGLLSHLADQLKVYTGDKLAESMRGLPRHERVLHRLKDSNRLIIVDEAHKLHPGGLEFLRELHDATGVPMLLLATKDLQQRIERDADPDHGQLYSRIPMVYPLVPEAKKTPDGRRFAPKPLFTVEDIKRLYHSTPIRLSDDATRYLCEIANELGHGSLRKCGNLVALGARRARKRLSVHEDDVVTVTSDDIQTAERTFKKGEAELEFVNARIRRAATA